MIWINFLPFGVFFGHKFLHTRLEDPGMTYDSSTKTHFLGESKTRKPLEVHQAIHLFGKPGKFPSERLVVLYKG